jgi:hypothetical protein
MGLPGDIADRASRSFAGLGSTDRRVSAQRGLALFGIGGTILSSAAIAPAAVGIVDVSSLAGRDVQVSLAWQGRCGIDLTPDATTWDFELLNHETLVVHLPDDALELRVLNLDKVDNYAVVVPIDQET